MWLRGRTRIIPHQSQQPAKIARLHGFYEIDNQEKLPLPADMTTEGLIAEARELAEKLEKRTVH